jgi:hypothetical protein
MSRLEGCGSAFGLFVTPAHDIHGVALLSRAFVHVDHKIWTAYTAANGLTEKVACPNQGDTVGHGKVSVVECLPVFGVATSFNDIIYVVEYRIPSLAALDGFFDRIQGLAEVPSANADTQDIHSVFLAAKLRRYHFYRRHPFVPASLGRVSYWVVFDFEFTSLDPSLAGRTFEFEIRLFRSIESSVSSRLNIKIPTGFGFC